MNKKLKKTLATISAIAMCATSMIYAPAGAIYTPTNKEIRPETTSFTANVYGEKIELNLWQEATDYFDDENTKIYISDKMVNDFGDEFTIKMISIHIVYQNESDGSLLDYCSVGLMDFGLYCFDENEDLVNFEEYLSKNNIAYEKWKYSSGIGGEIYINNNFTTDEYFQIVQKIKEDTGLVADWISPTDTVEIIDVENILHKSILIGDANEDSEVTIADAILIMQSIMNPDEYVLTSQGTANADIDSNGLTTMDALTIQEMITTK